jgi:hypothetical protein
MVFITPQADFLKGREAEASNFPHIICHRPYGVTPPTSNQGVFRRAVEAFSLLISEVMPENSHLFPNRNPRSYPHQFATFHVSKFFLLLDTGKPVHLYVHSTPNTLSDNHSDTALNR